MGDVVNLRTARKRMLREEKERRAELNRVRFGRSKAERMLARTEEQRATTDLDGHRLED